jgi:hypothetical protein
MLLRVLLNISVLCALGIAAVPAAADLVTFDELNLWSASTPQGTYYNGDSGIGDNSLGWSSGGVQFGNNYGFAPGFGDYWGGFAYSNVNNPSIPGFMNQYASITPTGVGGSGNYAIVYSGPQAFFNLPGLSVIHSIQVTNTAYAGLSMLQGDPYAKKFGGLGGNDPDFFSVRFEGYSGMDGSGSLLGVVDFYLADYRFDDNSLDYVIQDWTEVDLTPLGLVNSVRLSFNSSDTIVIDGITYINTPTYAALDNLSFTAVPEPSSLALCGIGACGWMAWRRRRGSTGGTCS